MDGLKISLLKSPQGKKWPQKGEWKQHTPCYGKVATAAAVYPFQLCRAIPEGLAAEMKRQDLKVQELTRQKIQSMQVESERE